MTTKTESIPDGTITSPKGFVAGAVFANINKYARHKLDLGILLSEVPCVAVGLFTSNKMKAAPVWLCQQKLPGNTARAVVVNSGCANAGTGEQGLADAVAIIDAVSEMIEVKPQDVLIASTGVIGRRLPLDSIIEALNKIELSPDGGHSLAKAIMTTDTTTKEVAVRADGSNFIIGGIAKGSGMIHPQLGTLLCFLATDAMADPEFLAAALKKAVDISFNMVSIDGDTSPNDTILLMANGLAGNALIRQNTAQAAVFQETLNHTCIHLAKAIARDGEGASKLIEVTISSAANTADARSAARTIVSSPLVKAAIHGNDPNWGRIIAAAGRSGAGLVESRLDLYIGGICLIKKGNPLPFDKNYMVDILKGIEVSIDLNLNLGEATATAWGCDLSEEYVTINSQYTT
jgi:glutamate N-acetyltransferase/amino-acid N-acetyltransferase